VARMEYTGLHTGFLRRKLKNREKIGRRQKDVIKKFLRTHEMGSDGVDIYSKLARHGEYV